MKIISKSFDEGEGFRDRWHVATESHYTVPCGRTLDGAVEVEIDLETPDAPEADMQAFRLHLDQAVRAELESLPEMQGWDEMRVDISPLAISRKDARTLTVHARADVSGERAD